MKCSSCTTELWGRPAICPVCGTPTGLSRRASRQTPPPWAPSTPATLPPTRTPAQPQPFFNASDLLDPEVLEAVPQAPPERDGDDFLSAGRQSAGPADPAPPGMINAADLFDPQVLADLTGSADEGRNFQNRSEAPEQDNYPAFAGGPQPQVAYQEEEEEEYLPAPPRPTTGKGPIAPLFRLTTLPTTGPQPNAPPPFPPPPAFPARDYPPPPEPEEAPDETAWRLQNGYRIVSGPPPLGVPVNRPANGPGKYPVGYPKTTAPRGKAAQNRRVSKVLIGTLSLLLVIAILGGAIYAGATRYFQLQALQPQPAKTTASTLPTVAPLAGYTIFPDHKLGISLQYANNWQKEADYDKSDAGYQGDLFYSGTNPGFNTGFEIGSSPQYANISPAQIDDYVLANPFPLSGISSIQTYASDTPTVHILNENWTAEDADITLNDGIALRITCLAIIYNGRGYTIFYFAPQNLFNTDYGQFFQPMLLSFRFLND